MHAYMLFTCMPTIGLLGEHIQMYNTDTHICMHAYMLYTCMSTLGLVGEHIQPPPDTCACTCTGTCTGACNVCVCMHMYRQMPMCMNMRIADVHVDAAHVWPGVRAPPPVSHACVYFAR